MSASGTFGFEPESKAPAYRGEAYQSIKQLKRDARCLVLEVDAKGRELRWEVRWPGQVDPEFWVRVEPDDCRPEVVDGD